MSFTVSIFIKGGARLKRNGKAGKDIVVTYSLVTKTTRPKRA
jgi:hypothetical protein